MALGQRRMSGARSEARNRYGIVEENRSAKGRGSIESRTGCVKVRAH